LLTDKIYKIFVLERVSSLQRRNILPIAGQRERPALKRKLREKLVEKRIVRERPVTAESRVINWKRSEKDKSDKEIYWLSQIWISNCFVHSLFLLYRFCWRKIKVLFNHTSSPSQNNKADPLAI
jgi:hypothetical protein